MYSAYLLNTDLWSYSKIGEKIGEKAIKGRVGMALSVFLSVCSNYTKSWRLIL